jgi:hypothetical protein
MGSRTFRWFPYNGRRHAVPDSLVVGDSGTTLCGELVAVPHTAPSKAEWCWPTCTGCDTSWRLHEGILPFPRQASSRARAPEQRASPSAART